MSYTLVVKEEAKEEIEEAYQWYEAQQEGVGEEFLNSLDNTFGRITENPDLFPEKYKSHRVVVLDRFPFLVVYWKEESTVIVSAVFHTSREPNEKYRK
jgi:plasmid stabilization system protein ParE